MKTSVILFPYFYAERFGVLFNLSKYCWCQKPPAEEISWTYGVPCL